MDTSVDSDFMKNIKTRARAPAHIPSYIFITLLVLGHSKVRPVASPSPPPPPVSSQEVNAKLLKRFHEQLPFARRESGTPELSGVEGEIPALFFPQVHSHTTASSFRFSFSFFLFFFF